MSVDDFDFDSIPVATPREAGLEGIGGATETALTPPSGDYKSIWTLDVDGAMGTDPDDPYGPY